MTRSRLIRGGGDRGATIVEFALVVSLFLALLFVIIDFGLAFRTKLIVDNGVQSAARVGAGLGNNLDVDLYLLDEFLGGLGSLPNGGADVLVYVEVYKVEADGSPDLGNTNRYFYTPDGNVATCDWSPCPKGSTGAVSNKPEWDTYGGGYSGWAWTPDERSVVLGSLDQIGVKAHYAHTFLTDFMPGTAPACDTPSGVPTNCWTEDTILRLEPLQFSAFTRWRDGIV